jgi:hypothetical protein
MARRKKAAKPRRKHPLYADSAIPPDHRGARRCKRCGLMAVPGDARHTGGDEDDFPPDPLPPTPPAAREREDRMLGETDQRQGAA